MLSTYLGYQLYGSNLTQSRQRTAAEPVVSLDEQYYNANIGKVKSASDLVNNYRLLSYAAKAFGLSDMTYAKSLLTKVLESDLTDSKSLANTLGDSRYTAFAKAFNFNTDGSIKTTAQMQTTAQQSTTESLFKANTTLSSTAATTATANYETAMKSITSVAQLEKSPAALGYVLEAYGIDSSTASSTFEQTLESDLTKSSSFVNQQADAGYLALSKAVSVNADGTAQATTQAETRANITATTIAYSSTLASDSTSQKAGSTETAYFLSKITGVTSVSDITSDTRLTAYLTKAYGLPSTTTTTSIQKALTSDLTKGNSFADTSPYPGFKAMAQAFNFDTSGTAGTVTQLQTTTQQQATTQLYASRQTSDTTTSAAATAYYNAHIGNVKSVSDLESDSKLLSYVTTAYGIGAKTSTATLNSIMENTNNIDTTSTNASLLAFKLGFNVDATGAATNPLTAQSSANVSATTSAYMANAATDAASQKTAKAATAYYQSAIANVTSVQGLLADPKLVAYLEQAYTIPTSTSTTTLKNILTSDVTNPKSVANTMGSATNQLAAAFDFTATGTIGTETQGAQSKAQLNAINNAYIDQTMETEAGVQNPGIALALYFQINASKITDAYSILADTKLNQVFRTILGTSSSGTSADIDAQAKTISSQINLADLKNPAKLNALIQRFSVLYDLNPPASTASLTEANILTGSTGSYDVTSLFGSSDTSS